MGLSFLVLGVAVCLGLYLCTTRAPNLPLLHGGFGAAGLVVLLATGKGNALFQNSVALITAAFLIGLFMGWRAWQRHSVPGLAILLHVTAAGIGYLLLAGLVLGHH